VVEAFRLPERILQGVFEIRERIDQELCEDAAGMASTRGTSWARVVRFAGPGLALSLMLVARMGVRADKPGPTPRAPTEKRAAALKGAPQTVSVGLYLQNIPEIDIKTNSFAAEFYLWFVWKGDIDPTLTYELTNAVNVSELVKIPIFVDANGNSAPDLLPDGRHLQQFHVYGRFGHPFPLGKYPFDDHDIVISLEDARHAVDALVHEVDVKGTAMRPDLVIPGWTLSTLQTDLKRSKFATTFGDPRTVGDGEAYSHVDFRLHIDRPVVGIVSKTVIPIAIIILITFGAFFCQASDIDARLCLTITALISAVALQFTAATELPPTGALLLLDKIYILSYVAILLVTFCSIAANRYVHKERPDISKRIDRVGLLLIAAGYFGTLTLFILRTR
jgi:hypothetical protein